MLIQYYRQIIIRMALSVSKNNVCCDFSVRLILVQIVRENFCILSLSFSKWPWLENWIKKEYRLIRKFSPASDWMSHCTERNATTKTIFHLKHYEVREITLWTARLYKQKVLTEVFVSVNTVHINCQSESSLGKIT